MLLKPIYLFAFSQILQTEQHPRVAIRSLGWSSPESGIKLLGGSRVEGVPVKAGSILNSPEFPVHNYHSY